MIRDAFKEVLDQIPVHIIDAIVVREELHSMGFETKETKLLLDEGRFGITLEHDGKTIDIPIIELSDPEDMHLILPALTNLGKVLADLSDEEKEYLVNRSSITSLDTLSLISCLYSNGFIPPATVKALQEGKIRHPTSEELMSMPAALREAFDKLESESGALKAPMAVGTHVHEELARITKGIGNVQIIPIPSESSDGSSNIKRLSDLPKWAKAVLAARSYLLVLGFDKPDMATVVDQNGRGVGILLHTKDRNLPIGVCRDTVEPATAASVWGEAIRLWNSDSTTDEEREDLFDKSDIEYLKHAINKALLKAEITPPRLIAIAEAAGATVGGMLSMEHNVERLKSGYTVRDYVFMGTTNCFSETGHVPTKIIIVPTVMEDGSAPEPNEIIVLSSQSTQSDDSESMFAHVGHLVANRTKANELIVISELMTGHHEENYVMISWERRGMPSDVWLAKIPETEGDRELGPFEAPVGIPIFHGPLFSVLNSSEHAEKS